MTPSLDSICDRFEADRKGGIDKPLKSYLAEVVEGQRSDLLNQLLQVELETHVQNGSDVDERDAHRLYPEYPTAVAKAFQAVRKRFPGSAEVRTDGKTPRPDGANVTAKNSDDDSVSSQHLIQPTVVLQVTKGPSKGKELRFTDHQTCIVGRSKEAHLRLSPNRQFSRFHCRLEINPPEVVVADLGSTNGTKVNGTRIETAALATGDKVTVGDTAFSVLIQQPARSPRSTITPTLVGDDEPADDALDSFDEPVPKIPGYAVERQVGHGSMGVVYVARRLAKNEKVAIKIIRPIAGSDIKVVEKFRREAAIVLRLQHKRIVKSLDFRLTNDHLPYLVMEYIDEVNLREVLDAASLADRCRMSAGIMVRALEGLQYAHDQEIVHRDVKPSNLLIYRAGKKLQVKLADFGLAKNFIDAGFSDCSTSNEICGTLAYMPPEQIIDCRHAKPTCDIYAAGVCLYNMISGRLPFEADMVAQQISLILNTQPTPITDHVADLPAGLLAIIDRALSRKIEGRYATAEEMRQELLPFTKRAGK